MKRLAWPSCAAPGSISIWSGRVRSLWPGQSRSSWDNDASKEEIRAAACRLELDPATRADLWQTVIAEIERYVADRDQLPIASDVSPDMIRADLAGLTFAQPLEPRSAIGIAVRGLREQQMHTPT